MPTEKSNITIPTLFCLVQEKPFEVKIDNLEKNFGRKDELKSAIEHALRRSANAEKEYIDPFKLKGAIKDLRLLVFNGELQYPTFPVVYILYEVDLEGGTTNIVDIIQ